MAHVALKKSLNAVNIREIGGSGDRPLERFRTGRRGDTRGQLSRVDFGPFQMRLSLSLSLFLRLVIELYQCRARASGTLVGALGFPRNRSRVLRYTGERRLRREERPGDEAIAGSNTRGSVQGCARSIHLRSESRFVIIALLGVRDNAHALRNGTD